MRYFQTMNCFYNAERDKALKSLIELFTPELRNYFRDNGAMCADLSEIRLRAGLPCSVTVRGKNEVIKVPHNTPLLLSKDELETVFSRLCSGSVYSQAESLKYGFAVRDGVRIGVGGVVSVRDGRVCGFSSVESLNIRIPVYNEKAADPVLGYIGKEGFAKCGGILAVSPPNAGKTTFLRALARGLSKGIEYLGGVRRFRVCLADERGELYNKEFFGGCVVDRLAMCPKAFAVESATALLSPEVIVCDEIRNECEADALLKAWSAGVILAASCHGEGASDVMKRPHLKRLVEGGVFGTVYSLHQTEGVYAGEIKEVSEWLK